MTDDPALQSRLSSVDHIGIVVRDVDASLPYYVDRLGLDVIHREKLGDVATELVYLDGGNTMIQLVSPTGPGFISEYLDEHGEGLHHICFAVRNIPSALSALELAERGDVFVGGRQRRACFLEDTPNEVMIELIEQEPIDQ